MADTADASATGSVHGTGIVVRDMARAIDFYSEVVGMREQRRIDVPDMHLFEVVMNFPGSSSASLVLMHYTDGVERTYTDIGGKIVLAVPDPKAPVEAARAGGYEVIREPAEFPGYGLIGFIRDPDGYALELLPLQG